MLRLKSKFVLVVAFLFSSALAPTSAAAPKDKQALKLANQAIMVEYLGTQFEQAAATLRKALRLCKQKRGNCSGKVIGQLHRDLGVVLITGLDQRDEGKQQLEQALKADPNVQLDEDLTTDDVKEVFEEVKATVPEDVPGIVPGIELEPEGVPLPIGGAEGDVIHAAPPEGAVLTPVPLYAELPEDVTSAKVKMQLRYKPFGAQRWKTLEMDPYKQGYAVEIPCLDISDVTGQLKYYIQATEAGDIVAFSGSRRKPNIVVIKQSLAGEPPRLPGKPPPAQCAAQDTPDCFDDEDCGEAAVCEDGQCIDVEVEAGPAKQNWLSISFQQDLILFPGETGVCSGSDNYTCFYVDGSQYGGIAMTEQGNRVNSGIGLATMRVLVGYDRVLFKSLTGGLRLGYAFPGGPKAEDSDAKKFMPFHAELRAAWWFLDNPFQRKGLRPYAFVMGGGAQIDGKVVVTVVNDPWEEQPDPREEGNETRMLEAWTKKGQIFVGLGGGIMYAVADNMGLLLEVKGGQMFPASGTFLAVSGGFGFGL